ncbi:sulfite exporter TauE/SafE family protein [Streptomyces sp. NPDC059009]|uniref:sulfite exporter TauE/SafE family protein n=1 Tax=Streptomyces sp. NPDC059009 TaxID=3346694 RepID=UPI003678156C
MPLIAVPCGLLIGLLLGSLGGGGSILAVPALVYLLGRSPHEAATGALVVVAVGAASGLACHARAGHVRWTAGAVFGALGTVGTYVGARWSRTLDPSVLMVAFAGLMLVVAVAMLVRDRRPRTGRERLPVGRDARVGAADGGARPGGGGAGGDARTRTAGSGTRTDSAAEDTPRTTSSRTAPAAPARHRRLAAIAAAATGVGLLTGFFGVGGGFVVVPALTLVLGMEMPAAVGTSLIVILINSATAFALRAGDAVPALPLLASFAVCAALGSWLGNRIAGRLHPRTLSTAFASLVTVLAVSMAVTSIASL